jgi:hypothetical protein
LVGVFHFGELATAATSGSGGSWQFGNKPNADRISQVELSNEKTLANSWHVTLTIVTAVFVSIQITRWEGRN